MCNSGGLARPVACCVLQPACGDMRIGSGQADAIAAFVLGAIQRAVDVAVERVGIRMRIGAEAPSLIYEALRAEIKPEGLRFR